jgi:hypothetical protein
MTDHRPPTHIDQRPSRVFISRLRSRSVGHSRGSGHSLWRAHRNFGPSPCHRSPAPLWARDYNESKELGEKDSTKRTPRQTEEARFWITPNPIMSHQLERQIVIAKNMDIGDSAHLMALASVAEADAGIALFEAKYTYKF